MAKRSDIEKQIADLQSQLDTADTDDEIWVKDADGKEYKVTGRRATGILGKLGLLEDDAAGEAEEGEDEADEPSTDTKGYGFGRRSKK